MAGKMMRTGFLFNHDHLHQIAHSATVAFELSHISASDEVVLITTSIQQREYLNRLAADYPEHRCTFVSIRLPTWLRVPAAVLDKVLPFTRILILKMNLELFAGFDVLVVSEKTSLLLRSIFGLQKLKLVYTAHGAGDRAIGFSKKIARFDLIFLSGEKIRHRMNQGGLLTTARSCVVGYPKFDAVHAFTRQRPRLFDNDKPVILYNPHFSPALSSWFSMGTAILDYFCQSDQYNLIFAPHVMLYKRKLHLALGKPAIGWAFKVPERYSRCKNIIIDTGSMACADMTYTLAADIYLGDVSSQIWEFLIKPRPCLFANSHQAEWKTDSNYMHWHNGPVFERIDQLDASLEQAIRTHTSYRALQIEMFRQTFEINEESSSRQGARAIYQFMH